MIKKLSIIVVITIVLLSSCFLEAPSSVLGTLELNLDYSGSRGTTLLYGLEEGDVTYLTIAFTGAEAFTETYSTAAASAGIVMLPGTYAAAITGYDADPDTTGVAIVSGTIASFTITTGETTGVTTTLSAGTAGTGDVSLVVNWSASGKTVSDTYATFDLIGASIPTEVSVTENLGSSNFTYSASGVASGDYMFKYVLYDDTSAELLSSEVLVQVRDNLTSSGTVTLLLADFEGNTDGTLTVGFTVNLPSDETIVFASDDVGTALADDEIYDNDTDTFNVYVQSGYTDYIWSLTGVDLSASDGTNNTTIDTTALSAGVYHLTVYVQSGGAYYSDTLRFIVVD